ncbi:ABC transporter substrate-binding protein [Amycolatopsis acidiphila]|uniref:Substrate-binding domain-containing protein n=1 Tax=Amycolatopsis acidiphila TaxID=715473 RepID=A0A557ZXX3_9PSEU|nr:ABC transporter substrate-binding protein [Amycolatopsis acidiphila]TVT16865.1 substrate-binding domain-containing protein [Amycolatopsis acidiphila]UIJ58712.1 ABC transporter substrate-binding protein [Amycolatopsis acidiphila]GHG75897.1 sugar ABC transporter substrate-binding protein [Amycolatopsis acidiphila]
MKKVLTAGTAVAAAVLLAACGSGQVGGSGGGDSVQNNKQLALIPGVQAEPFYISMQCGAEAEAKKLGYTVTTSAPQKFDAALQTEKVNALGSSPPAALLIAPTDDTAMLAPIQQVANRGTKIVQVDTALKDSSLAVSSISSDNVEGGKLAAQTLAQLVGDKPGSVLVLDTIAGTSTTAARAQGFSDELKNHPNLKSIGIQFTQNEPEQAAAKVTAALASTPDLIGIFATNLNTGEGAATGLRNAGKIGQVNLVGFDASPSEVDGLRSGEYQALIAQDPAMIGQQGVDQAVAALENKPVTKTLTAPLHSLTKANMDANSQYFYKQQC